MFTDLILLFLAAIATFILELLVFRKKFKDAIDKKYLTKIVLLVNLITNIVLNSILIVMFGDTIRYTSFMIFTIGALEAATVFIEYIMYRYAFRYSIEKGKILKKNLFWVTLLANIFSLAFGTFLIHVLAIILVLITIH